MQAATAQGLGARLEKCFFAVQAEICYNLPMSKLEVIEREIENLSARERRTLKLWFDQLEGQTIAPPAPTIRLGNGQKAKGLQPRIQMPSNTQSLSDTVSELREARESNL
jgi:hypothetical protein